MSPKTEGGKAHTQQTADGKQVLASDQKTEAGQGDSTTDAQS